MQKRLTKLLSHLLANKYLLVLSIFVVWLIFFDNNNLVTRKRLLKETRQLKADCEYYKQRIVSESARLSELREDSESLEKFAREQYLMKRDNEEIFIFSEK